MTRLVRVALVLGVWCLAVSVLAQEPIRPPAPATFAIAPVGALPQVPVPNPTAVDFAPSPDHSATQNGAAVLTRYDLEIYTPTGSMPVQAATSLGKPTPVGGLITYSQLATVLATVAPGTYVAKIASVGPGGTSRSANSNPFEVVPRMPAASGTPVIR